jgi:hypothetical protein
MTHYEPMNSKIDDPPVRTASILLAMLTAAAGLLVWGLYPSLPDPVILEEGKAGIPLIVVVSVIFFVQANVVLGHHRIPKTGILPALIKQRLIYFDIFFLLLTLSWLGLTLRFLLENAGYYFRGIYFFAGTIALFSGYFSFLGSRPWIKEAVLQSKMEEGKQAEWLKVIGFSSKVLGILAGFACLGFIFPDWQTGYGIGLAIIVIVALIPLQGMLDGDRKKRRS